MIIEREIAPLASMRLVEPDVRWRLDRDCPALFEAVQARLPGVAALGRELCEKIPVQVDWHFGEDGPVTRPDRHVRAFYLDLPKLSPELPSSIAIKGSEVWAENFGTLVERLRLTWSIFT